MLDIPSGVQQDPPQPPDAPYTITDAYTHLAVTMYQSGMGYADLPEQVHRAHGILRREFTRLDALPTYTLNPP